MVYCNISYFSFKLYGGVEFMHKKRLSEAFMSPACSFSKAAIKMLLFQSTTLIVVILSLALKADYHYLALYIN